MSRGFDKQEQVAIVDRMREAYGIENYAELARRIGISKSTISDYRACRKQIGIDVLRAVSSELGVSLDWLVTGQERHSTLEIALTDEELADNFYAIPLLKDAAAAGTPAKINERDIESKAMIFRDRRWIDDPKHFTCVKVHGDSMEPTLLDGCIVAIDHRRPTNLAQLQNKIVAFRHEGGVTIKRFLMPRPGLVLGLPDNPERLQDTVTLMGEEIDSGIIGRVAWWWGRQE